MYETQIIEIFLIITCQNSLDTMKRIIKILWIKKKAITVFFFDKAV